MKKTLLLCFIHGFKGGNDTFGGFPEHLRALISHALPKIGVVTIVYPKFETRGDLKECVGRFREWLQNKVIDLEVENGTPSPTVDPSVRVVLVGHSMGGIVAAETAIAITSEEPLGKSPETNSFMFPYIQAVLAFDTPYLGIAPGVVAHAAEGHYNTATSTLTQLSGLASGLGLWGAATSTTTNKGPQHAITSPPTTPNHSRTASTKEPPPSTAMKDGDAAASPAWQRWGKMAMFAGAASAVAAGGAAAFLKREQLGEGLTWISSHLEFVGCLARGEELRQRLKRVVALQAQHSVGFANLYTLLGKAAQLEGEQRTAVRSGVLDGERMFCILPGRAESEWRERFLPALNERARDETLAHMNMFYPKENPGYFQLAEQAKTLVVGWASNDWYGSATGAVPVPSVWAEGFDDAGGWDGEGKKMAEEEEAEGELVTVEKVEEREQEGDADIDAQFELIH